MRFEHGQPVRLKADQPDWGPWPTEGVFGFPLTEFCDGWLAPYYPDLDCTIIVNRHYGDTHIITHSSKLELVQ